MSFLTNLKLEDFIKLSEEKKEIKHKIEKVDDCILHIFCYSISTPDLFKTDIERECRGITFNDDGVCVCRPFHKFFSIGEKEETLPDNIKWKDIKYVSEKIDGSLLTPVLINDRIYWKTKKSFFSNVALDIQKAWDNKAEWVYQYKQFIIEMLKNNFTPCFEYISPDNRIVIDYGNIKRISHLCTRHNGTGKYFVNADICNSYYVNFLNERENNYQNFIQRVKETPDVEGYVLYTEFGENIYKLKTQWYLDRHHLLSSLSYREIIKMIQEDRIDDIISELRLKGFFKQVKLVEGILSEYNTQINYHYDNIYIHYDAIMEVFKNESLDKRKFALYVMKNEYLKSIYSFLFCLYDGKDEQFSKLLNKYISENLIEKYKNKIIFMGEEQ